MHEDMYAMSVVFGCASTTQNPSHMLEIRFVLETQLSAICMLAHRFRENEDSIVRK